jgi:hypothetical protein
LVAARPVRQCKTVTKCIVNQRLRNQGDEDATEKESGTNLLWNAVDCGPAVLQIVEELAPKEMSIDKIERVLNELIEDQKKSDPTTH